MQAIDNVLLTSLDLVEIKILILNRLNGEFKVLQPKFFRSHQLRSTAQTKSPQLLQNKHSLPTLERYKICRISIP